MRLAPIVRALGASRGARTASGAVPVVLVAIATILRFVNLGNRELFRDEAASWLLSSYPLGSLLDHARFEAYPPLYAVALQLWTGLFGDSEAAMRSLSVAAAVATLAVVWAWGRQALGRVPACIALALAGLSVLLITDARDARMYATETAFATASWWLTWRLAVLPAPRVPWRSLVSTAAMLAITASGELWTLAFGIPIAALQVAFAGSVAMASIVGPREPGRSTSEETARSGPAAATRWQARIPRGPVLAIAAIAVGALVFLAWLPALLSVATNGQPFWTGRPTIAAFAQTFGLIIGLQGPWIFTAVADCIAAILAVAGIVGLLGLGRRSAGPAAAVVGMATEEDDTDRDRRRWFGVALIFALALCPIVWIYSQIRPIYDARYFGAIAPPLCLLIAAGVPAVTRRLGSRVVPSILLIVVLATMAAGGLDFVQMNSVSNDLDPAQETVARLIASTSPGDVVIATDARTFFPIDYYLERAGGEQAYGLRLYDWYGPGQPFFYGTYLISSDRVVTPNLVGRVGWRRALPALRSGGSIWLITITAGTRADIGFSPIAAEQLIEQSRQLVQRPGDLSGRAGQILRLTIASPSAHTAGAATTS